MAKEDFINQIDFSVNEQNLYREEAFTDLQTASIRRLMPVNPDGGTVDKNRKVIFVGSTQLMTPDGPLPLQAVLEAETLQGAIQEFPKAMREATKKMVDQLQRLQKNQKKDESRIIVPGR